MAVWLHGKAADVSLVADPVFSALDLLDGINEVYKNIR
jgi:NAD(P)H-hydrate repair Nnr-like enzyme with NAD(P)H-hydrate dehydratase domain